MITDLLNYLGNHFLRTELQDHSLVEHEIIHSITPTQGQYIWNKSGPIEYSFDGNLLPNLGDPSPSFTPINSETKEWFLSVMGVITQQTSIQFKEITTPLFIREGKYLFIGLTEKLSMGVKGVTRTLGTVDGTPEGRALVRSIHVSTDVYRSDKVLASRVFLHELLHAAGLVHPESSLISDAYPTVMDSLYVDSSVRKCHFTQAEKDCSALSTLTKIDTTAVELQNKRTEDPDFSSVYDESLLFNLGREILSETISQLSKTSVSIYYKTLIKQYFIPLLIQEIKLTNRSATKLKTLMEIAIDLLFWPLASVISAHAITILMKFFIAKMSTILPKFLHEKDMQFATTMLISVMTGEPLTALCMYPLKILTAKQAEILAHQTIRLFPKLKIESNILLNTLFKPALSESGNLHQRRGYAPF